MLKKIIAALIPLSLTLLVSVAQAATGAGTVLVATGTNTAKNTNGELRTLARGDSIQEGDTVNTAAGAKLSLRMKDQAVIVMDQGTEFTVDKYQLKSDGDKKDAASLKLAKGALLTMSGQMEKAAYKLEIPVSTLGIRGTIFEVTQNPDGSWLVTVAEGAVIVTNDDGDEVTVPAGKGLIINADGSFDAALLINLSDDKVSNMMERLEEAGADNPNFRNHLGDKNAIIKNKPSAGTRDDGDLSP